MAPGTGSLADMARRTPDTCRNKLVERLKAVQAKQATEAASRPESKQWIDPALIERYTRWVPSCPAGSSSGGSTCMLLRHSQHCVPDQSGDAIRCTGLQIMSVSGVESWVLSCLAQG